MGEIGGTIAIEPAVSTKTTKHNLSLDAATSARLSRLCAARDWKPSEVLCAALSALAFQWDTEANAEKAEAEAKE